MLIILRYEASRALLLLGKSTDVVVHGLTLSLHNRRLQVLFHEITRSPRLY
jgi:hypothetical protein